jgi:hypothetical protein
MTEMASIGATQSRTATTQSLGATGHVAGPVCSLARSRLPMGLLLLSTANVRNYSSTEKVLFHGRTGSQGEKAGAKPDQLFLGKDLEQLTVRDNFRRVILPCPPVDPGGFSSSNLHSSSKSLLCHYHWQTFTTGHRAPTK